MNTENTTTVEPCIPANPEAAKHANASRHDLGTMVRGIYQIQQTRIAVGNRIVAQAKSKAGQAPSEAEETMPADAKQILTLIRLAYNRVTDGVINYRKLLRGFKGDDLISSTAEFLMIKQYIELEDTERNMQKDIATILLDFPIYTEFLRDVKGVGPLMASVIISSFDIHASKYASSMYRYAGLDVVTLPDGTSEGRGSKKSHLVDKTYTNAKGETVQTKGLSHNRFLKTKLIGVLASSFIKLVNCHYRKVYDDKKHFYATAPKHAGKTKKHIDNMAKRYMIKIFIADLYARWRELEGLEVYPPYGMAKMGLAPHNEGRQGGTIAAIDATDALAPHNEGQQGQDEPSFRDAWQALALAIRLAPHNEGQQGQDEPSFPEGAVKRIAGVS